MAVEECIFMVVYVFDWRLDKDKFLLEKEMSY